MVEDCEELLRKLSFSTRINCHGCVIYSHWGARSFRFGVLPRVAFNVVFRYHVFGGFQKNVLRRFQVAKLSL